MSYPSSLLTTPKGLTIENRQTPTIESTADIRRKGDYWMFFGIPIIVTLAIFIVVVILICIRKRNGVKSWADVCYNCIPQQEEGSEEEKAEYGNKIYDDFLSLDGKPPSASPVDAVAELPSHAMVRTRGSCPAVSYCQMKPHSSIDDDQFYAYVDSTKFEVNVSSDVRRHRSESDVAALKVSAGTSYEKFKLSLQRMNARTSDIPKDNFSSYVILDGTEYKIPSSVPKYEPPILSPPEIPRDEGFLEICLNECEHSDQTVKSRSRSLSPAQDVPHTELHKASTDIPYPLKELPRSPTETSRRVANVHFSPAVVADQPTEVTAHPLKQLPPIELFHHLKQLPLPPAEGHYPCKELPQSPSKLLEDSAEGVYVNTAGCEYQSALPGKNSYARSAEDNGKSYEQLRCYKKEVYLSLTEDGKEI